MRYTRFMNAIITVVGSDKVGIIAKVSGFLAEIRQVDRIIRRFRVLAGI